jgi:hypothetical protein
VIVSGRDVYRQTNSIVSMHKADLLIMPKKCGVRYLFGNAAKSWIARGHRARGKAEMFETPSDQLRVGIMTLSLIYGKLYVGLPNARFGMGGDNRKSFDPSPSAKRHKFMKE